MPDAKTPEPKTPEAAPAPATRQLIANHLVYHTAGKAPALPGSVFEVAEEHVPFLLSRGAARHLSAPPPFGSAAVQPGVTGPAPPTVVAEGAETLPIPPPPPAPKTPTPAAA